uniref:Uncharacterized protein n=1 Tax=Vitis vinifera TaxID=29760 RepID=A5BJ86_VITVI|nr:hypothetical protein VITISV_038537 [Vitis vinifera]
MVELPLEICRLKSFGISESSIHEYKKGTYKAEELDKIEVFDIRQWCRFLDLTWLIYAPSLERMLVFRSKKMEEIIEGDECGESEIEQQNLRIFSRLVALDLIVEGVDIGLSLAMDERKTVALLLPRTRVVNTVSQDLKDIQRFTHVGSTTDHTATTGTRLHKDDTSIGLLQSRRDLYGTGVDVAGDCHQTSIAKERQPTMILRQIVSRP